MKSKLVRVPIPGVVGRRPNPTNSNPGNTKKAPSLCPMDVVSVAKPPVYEEVISVGVDCLSAWRLKVHGLRRAAFPFDWLKTDVSTVIHMIRHPNTWADFDKMYCLENGNNPSIVNKGLYIHIHHVRGRSFVPDQHAYFLRCIQRWRNLFENTNNKTTPRLFMLAGQFEQKHEQLARTLAATIREINPLYGLLYVSTPPASKVKVEKIAWEPANGFYHFLIHWQPNGKWQQNNLKMQWNEIFAHFNLQIPTDTKPTEPDAFSSET